METESLNQLCNPGRTISAVLEFGECFKEDRALVQWIFRASLSFDQDK
jgi:hypothetical protein